MSIWKVCLSLHENNIKMKAKKSLLPKSKLWISLTLIFLPVLLFFIFLQFEVFETSDVLLKVSRIIGSVSLFGMFLLFMSQWTKDDGDEMYLQMRLRAVLYGVVVGITGLLVSSVFSLVNWLDIDHAHYNGFGLMFFILFMILTNYGLQMYALSKQKEE